MDRDALKIEDDLEHVKCNLCGSDDPILVFIAIDRLYKKSGLFGVVRCSKCGLIYTNPRPTNKSISCYYPHQYWDLKAASSARINIISKIEQYLINAIRYNMTIPLRTNGRLLDIGCGDGKFLVSMKNLGWEVHGVEISDIAAKNAREKLGLDCFSGTVEDASYPDSFFHGITMHQVLEHVADPTATLLEVNRILKRDGLLAISVPNASSIEAQIFKKYWFAWDIPRHFYHFSPEKICDLLEKTGFELRAIEYDPHPGTILNSFQYILEDLKISPKINYILISTIAFPLAYILGLFFSEMKSSGSMAIYATKK